MISYIPRVDTFFFLIGQNHGGTAAGVAGGAVSATHSELSRALALKRNPRAGNELRAGVSTRDIEKPSRASVAPGLDAFTSIYSVIFLRAGPSAELVDAADAYAVRAKNRRNSAVRCFLFGRC